VRAMHRACPAEFCQTWRRVKGPALREWAHQIYSQRRVCPGMDLSAPAGRRSRIGSRLTIPWLLKSKSRCPPKSGIN
jgi:hypothetical protein